MTTPTEQNILKEKKIIGKSAECPFRKEKPTRCQLCQRILSGTTGKQRFVRNLWCTNCFKLYEGSPLMFLEKAKLLGYQLAQKETAEKVEKLKEEFSNTSKYTDGEREDNLENIDKIFNEDKE